VALYCNNTMTVLQLVMGPGQFSLLGLGQVGSGQPSLAWVWKISPKDVKFFSFFPVRSKTSRPLIDCGSKVSSDRVWAHLYLQCHFSVI